MVSLQSVPSLEEKEECSNIENSVSKRRKYRDGEEYNDCCFTKMPKLVKATEKPNMELPLNTPLPLEWQQCLDIKSGEVHFYNTKTHKTTSQDPRLSPKSASPCLSLDLKLNLTPTSQADGDLKQKQHAGSKNYHGSILRSLPWISLDADQQEMVATVCMHCHMLVMMCKATLSCPNCKFVHPPYM